MRVLEEYFADAGNVTEHNAWEHVYRCLLWMNLDAGLAHIYDSNHMQTRGTFHSRAARFTDFLCKHWGIDHAELPGQIDFLFKGCVAHWKQRRAVAAATSETDSTLISEIEEMLQKEGIGDNRAGMLARQIETLSRDYFTIGKKRSNALGEGFEDLLAILLKRVSNIPDEKLALRCRVSELPGFRRAPVQNKGERRKREPKPDIAIIENNVTHIITTAKWSMRQDRETQFQSEYNALQMNKVQSTELRYALITNEFDIARLLHVAQAMPGGTGGYIFHHIYHVNLPFLRETQGNRFKELEAWVGTGKLKSLSDYLADMRGHYGEL